MQTVGSRLPSFGLLILSGIFSAAGISRAVTYSLGHGDVRPYYEDGSLKICYQLDYNAVVADEEVGTFETGPVSFSISSLTTSIPSLGLELPDNPDFAFLGAAPGASIYYIPQTQETDRPWLGFSTEELEAYDWQGPGGPNTPGYLKLDLLGVTGPEGAQFSMCFNYDEGNPWIPHFATSDGIGADDTYKSNVGDAPFAGLSLSSHAHVNWMFTEPGIYDVTLRFSGNHLVDGYKEATATLTFAVGVPEPTSGVLIPLGAACLFRRRR